VLARFGVLRPGRDSEFAPGEVALEAWSTCASAANQMALVEALLPRLRERAAHQAGDGFVRDP
jgi:hypothetical protein